MIPARKLHGVCSEPDVNQSQTPAIRTLAHHHQIRRQALPCWQYAGSHPLGQGTCGCPACCRSVSHHLCRSQKILVFHLPAHCPQPPQMGTPPQWHLPLRCRHPHPLGRTQSRSSWEEHDPGLLIRPCGAPVPGPATAWRCPGRTAPQGCSCGHLQDW